jgi:hypothetical protein
MEIDFERFKETYRKLCPCLAPNRVNMKEENLCPCKTFIDTKRCRCGIFRE